MSARLRGAHVAVRSTPLAARAAFALAGVWLVINEFRIVALHGTSFGLLGSRWAHDAVLVAASALCLVRAGVDRDQRAGWLLIGLGMLAWTFGELYYTAVLWSDSNPPIPSPADAGYLLFAPLSLPGLCLLLRRRAGGLPKVMWADGLTAALAVGALSAAIVFSRVVSHESGTPIEAATSLAYPLMDTLILSAIFGSLARMGWRADRTWGLLAVGMLLNLVADSLYEVYVASGTYQEGSWFDTGWWAGFFLIAAAAWQPRSRPLEPRPEPGGRTIAVPLLFGALGLALLVYGCLAPLTPLAIALAAASLVAVMGRLMLTFADNVAMLRHSRGEALTDPLTGVGNRRALTRALERFFAAGDEPGRLLALLDLDGFKAYNDRFGHPAGDALLVRLAGRLRAELGSAGEVFRLGGDEFCVLADGESARDSGWLERTAGVLSEHGDGFQIGCSYGAVRLPEDAQSVSEALELVDRSMYAHKQDGRASAGRQAHDALVSAMTATKHGLDDHGAAVAELATLTATMLGLPPAEASEVRQAAELHDIGMVAVPEAILAKRGPLSEAEWAFVREHPSVGARIIAAAPALGSVARLVRHSHERWDGNGYPDGLAGEEVPLGARIIAVADAFETMTRAQPYRAAMTVEEATAELRRCAGKQFDEVVVRGFLSAMAARGKVVTGASALSVAPPAWAGAPSL
jgi:two-component system cell cycle response regulator